MIEKNLSPGFRSKNIDKTRNYFLEETKRNGLMGRKHKKSLCNYILNIFLF